MGKLIVKLNDLYCEWSTVVDAPITPLMNLSDFKQYYLKEYGNSSESNLNKRLLRVMRKGTSCLHSNNVNELISCNRAGPNEINLSKDEIIKQYK